MTEPRKPEAVPEDGVPHPEHREGTRPDGTAWYPVAQPPAAPPQAEPVETTRPEHDEPTGRIHPVENGSDSAQAVGADAVVDPTEVGRRDPAGEDTEATEDEPRDERTEFLGAGASVPGNGDAEPTAVVNRSEDDEDSRTQPLLVGAGATAAAAAPADGIFRPATPTSSPSPEPTRMEPLSEEERKLAAERAARREARTAALSATAPPPVPAPQPVVIHKRTNDGFWASLGLFLLRLVLAGVFAIRGLNILTDIPAAEAAFARTILPEPGLMAIITGVAAELIALALLLGLLTRIAGLGVALIAGGALAFVYWGSWSIFVPGQPGFLGEYELVLAAVGVLLLLIGGGGWSLDRAFRAGRERDKRERVAADE